jgi:protocatechuate 3,4-dioxygenase beta subunit
LALVLIFCMVAASPAWSQAATAAVTGTVSDPTGAVIPGAEVTVTQASTGVIRTAVTDATGKYLIAQLAPATYRIEIKMSGFKTAVRENVELLVGTTSALNV